MKKVIPVRIPVYIKTTIAAGDKTYAGVIGNISANGAFVENETKKTVAPFMPGKELKLKFKTSPGNTLNLNCVVIWLYSKEATPDGFANSLGLEIIKPPAKFIKWLTSL